MTMKAAILKNYAKQGTECVLMDIPIPEPGAGEALIRITAAGVNPLDNMIIRGEVSDKSLRRCCVPTGRGQPSPPESCSRWLEWKDGTAYRVIFSVSFTCGFRS